MKGLFTLPKQSGKADRMLEQGRERKATFYQEGGIQRRSRWNREW